MAVNRYATQAGKKYETDLMRHLRERGLDVERLRLSGAEDEGDLLLRLRGDGPPTRLVIEAKRTKAMDLGGWVKEAEVERQNYTHHRSIPNSEAGFVVVHYRRQHNLGQSYVTTTLEEYLHQLGVA